MSESRRDSSPRRQHGRSDSSDIGARNSNSRTDRYSERPKNDRPHSHRSGGRERHADSRSNNDQRDRRDDGSRRERRVDDDSARSRRYRERSRSGERSHYRDRSRSPPPKRRRRSESNSRSPQPSRKSRAPLPSQNESFSGTKDVDSASGPPVEKEKPNYKPTGLLAKEANTVAGTTTILKYHEPPEARKPPPKEQWRMYVFKQKDLLDTVYLHQRSVWLMGRDQKVTDLHLEHPSISKQHAVIQFRYSTSTNEYGDKTSRVKPYLIDLESPNGTKLNGEKVETSRYLELVDGDVVAFGDSEREYVLMLPPPTDKKAST